MSHVLLKLGKYKANVVQYQVRQVREVEVQQEGEVEASKAHIVEYQVREVREVREGEGELEEEGEEEGEGEVE